MLARVGVPNAARLHSGKKTGLPYCKRLFPPRIALHDLCALRVSYSHYHVYSFVASTLFCLPKVHLTTPFAAGEFEGFGHRSQIRHVIVGEMIVEAALALCEKNRMAKNKFMEPIEGDETSSAATGRVSLRDLLGKPPYGTV